METYFRYVAIFSLLFRIGVTFYISSRSRNAGACGRTANAADATGAGSASGRAMSVRQRFAPPHLVLFSNIWLTIGMTFWVTALLVDREYSIS